MRRRRPEPCPARRAHVGSMCSCALFVITAACAAPELGPIPDDEAGEVPEIIEIRGGATGHDQTPRELHFVRPPAPEPERVAYALPTRTVYLNRHGGTYSPGYENSSTNATSIPYYTSTIAPWNPSGSAWNSIVECVRGQFEDFNVVVTDTDPGTLPHLEAVIAGYPEDLQLPSTVGGASPFASDCSFIERSIVFVFPDSWNNDQRLICEVIAHEIGHSVGLDHEYLCADPMTYLEGCGNKSFQNVDAFCGEYSPASCYCSATQNSVEILTARLGPADSTAPAVSIVSPSDGAVVAPGFSVQVEASDDVGVSRVELHVDGVLVDTSTAWPYQFTTDASLADGTHVVETRAYDARHVSSASIAVEVSRDDGSQDPPEDPPEDPSDDDSEPPTTPVPTGPDGVPTPDLWKGCAAGGTGGSLPTALVVVLVAGLLRRRKKL